MSTREDILARLTVVASGVSGIVTALRNSTVDSDTKLPAIIVFDADEVADERDPASRPTRTPRRVTMTPELLIKVIAVPETVGTTMNAILAELQTAVVTDATLIDLVKDGEIRYMGCATQLAIGRAMVGEMGVSFSFHYVLS